MNKIRETYQKYEHLDKLLSDNDWLPKTIQGQILYDLWQTVKHEALTNQMVFEVDMGNK